jgi:hypothetical protein
MASNNQAVVQETTREDSPFGDSFEDLIAAVKTNNLEMATSWLNENGSRHISYDMRSDDLVDGAVASGNFKLLRLIMARFAEEGDMQERLTAQGPAASLRARHAFNNLSRLFELALQSAAKHGCLSILQQLLMNSQGKAYSSAFLRKKAVPLLLLAAENGHLAVVKWLVEQAKANVAEKNQAGETALLLAAQEGRLAVVEWLLNQTKTKVTEKDREGRTALLLAAKHKREIVVTKLVADYGADPGDGMSIARLLLGADKKDAVSRKAAELRKLYETFARRSSPPQEVLVGVQSASQFTLLAKRRPLELQEEVAPPSPSLTDMLLLADPALKISQLGK